MSNKNNPTAKGLLTGLIFGLLMGAAVAYLLVVFNQESLADEPATAEKKPLYWVAPMDPNYRRDQPGQSPMGMDLIPYYGNDASDDDSAGTVRISSNVINNLGVRTEKAQFLKVQSAITAVGVVKYNEEQLFHIHPRVEGWIEKLYINSSGESVEKNQPVYDIYSPELVNAQEELLLALNRNNNQLIQAAEDRLKSLQFSNTQIQQLKKSRSTQQRVTFYSPHKGVVERLKIREGFFVKPGDNVMSIGALEDVWIEVDVLEKQAAMIELNQPVIMTLDYVPGRTWVGQVDFIYPTLDATTRTLKVRLKFNNQDEVLKPNMYAQVSIQALNDQAALVVPAEAVIRTGHSDRVVLALGEGQFKSINVKLGQSYDDYIEIIAGLEAGDVVVTSAQFLIDSESSKSSDFKRMTKQQLNSTEIDHSNMDHSNMDHSNMDHSNMDHSNMDHSNMDHSNMDHSNMDHSKPDEAEVDHSQMDHSQMDHSQMDLSKPDETEVDHSQMDHSKMNHSQMSEPDVERVEIEEETSEGGDLK